jgi:hypothetical protein
MESDFWGATHVQVTEILIEQDRSGFNEALESRKVIAWLASRADAADPESFAGLHKFAVMAVAATLRLLDDTDVRVVSLYEDWAHSKTKAESALRLAAKRQ